MWKKITEDLTMEELAYKLLEDIDVEENEIFSLHAIIKVGKRRFMKVIFPFTFQYLGEFDEAEKLK